MRSRTLGEGDKPVSGAACLGAAARGKTGWAVGAAVLLLGVCGAAADAQSPLNNVLTQTTLLGGFPSGGSFGSGTAAGSTFAVNSQGNVFFGTSYGGDLAEYSATTGQITKLGSYSNIGPIAVDGSDNLFVGNVYSSTIVKLPFVSGAYPAFSTPGASTPVCAGNDTTECTMPSSLVSGPYGLSSMAFDAKGDLFYASGNNGSAADDTIFECNVSCLASAAPAATVVFAEPAGTSTLVGGMAFDASGDLFFTDALFVNTTNQGNEENTSSAANELVSTGTGATGFATSKTVLYTLTAPTPLTMYNNEITSIAVGPDGTVYFASENDGIFAYPSSKGVVNTTTLYTVSTAGAKEMATDGKGDFFTANYSATTGGDAMTRQGIQTLTAPTTEVDGSATLTGVIAIDNATLSCSPTPTLSISVTEPGTTTPEYTAKASGSCTSANITSASTVPVTVTFSPTTAGTRTATLTTTSSDGTTGTAMVTGIAAQPAPAPTFNPPAGTYTSIQTVALVDSASGAAIYYTTDGSTPTTASTLYSAPITVSGTETISAIAVVTGDTNSAVATALYTINLPTAAPTYTPAGGTYNALQNVTILDATPGAVIYYTTDGTTPTTSSTVYSGPIPVGSTEMIQAVALAPGFTLSAVTPSTYTVSLPTFGLAIEPGTLTMTAGTPAEVNVTVTGFNSFNANVTFACSGLPTGATCTFTPTTIAPTGSYTATTVLAINVPTTAAAVEGGARGGLYSAATFALALGLFGWRRRRGVRLLTLVVGSACGLMLLNGCGSSPASTRKATTSTVTVTATAAVTATSPMIVQTSRFSLVVQ